MLFLKGVGRALRLLCQNPSCAELIAYINERREWLAIRLHFSIYFIGLLACHTL